MSTTSDRKSRPRLVLVNRALILNKKGELLLIQRSKDDTWQPNKWELPGGKLDAGQDISNALEREALEETGLVVVPIDKIVYMHSEILTKGKYKGLSYIVLVGLTKHIGNRVTLSDEHQDFAWVSAEQALKYNLTQATRAAITVLENKLS